MNNMKLRIIIMCLSFLLMLGPCCINEDLPNDTQWRLYLGSYQYILSSNEDVLFEAYVRPTDQQWRDYLRALDESYK